jgi:hypothetical protein
MLVNTITLTLLLLLLLPINITITIAPLLLPTNPRLTRPIPIHNELLVLILNHKRAPIAINFFVVGLSVGVGFFLPFKMLI